MTTLVFGLIHLSGDPLAGLLPPGSSPSNWPRSARGYGLDRPLLEQYLGFLRRAAQGDFGESWRQGRPALAAVLDRLPATLALTARATALAILLGGALGDRGGRRDRWRGSGRWRRGRRRWRRRFPASGSAPC